MTRRTRFLAAAALGLGVQAAMAQVTIISDNFNTDTSSDYTVVNAGLGAPDGTLAFGFDYSSLLGADGNPIPVAPGTTDGSKTGVQISVNRTVGPNAGFETEGYTIFHNTEITNVMDYTMTVDVYLRNWILNSPPGNVGTTQHATIGVAGDGATVNLPFEFNGQLDAFNGSGNYVFITSDGSDSSDYRHWRDNANGTMSPGPINRTPQNPFDDDYLSPDGDTNVTSATYPFYQAISNINAPMPGMIGNGWATVKVEVLQSEGLLKYHVRGATAETTGNPSEPPEFLQIIESPLYDTDGFVNFGLADLYGLGSVVPMDQVDNQFALFDNLLVVGSNLPGGIDGDFNDDGFYDCLDVDDLVSQIVSGADNTDFDLNGDGFVNTADLTDWLAEAGEANIGPGVSYLVGDANLDGSVDVSDFNIWNGAKFTSTPAWCSGDFNADGSIDVSDFNLWNGAKFQTAGGGALVPEPSSAGLWIAAVCGLALLRRRG